MVGDAHDGVRDAHAWSEMRMHGRRCAFLGGTQNLGPTPEKSDEKKSRDLANPGPPQGPPGLPRHFSKFQRGRSVEQFDEL